MPMTPTHHRLLEIQASARKHLHRYVRSQAALWCLLDTKVFGHNEKIKVRKSVSALATKQEWQPIRDATRTFLKATKKGVPGSMAEFDISDELKRYVIKVGSSRVTDALLECLREDVKASLCSFKQYWAEFEAHATNHDDHDPQKWYSSILAKGMYLPEDGSDHWIRVVHPMYTGARPETPPPPHPVGLSGSAIEGGWLNAVLPPPRPASPIPSAMGGGEPDAPPRPATPVPLPPPHLPTPVPLSPPRPTTPLPLPLPRPTTPGPLPTPRPTIPAPPPPPRPTTPAPQPPPWPTTLLSPPPPRPATPVPSALGGGEPDITPPPRPVTTVGSAIEESRLDTTPLPCSVGLVELAIKERTPVTTLPPRRIPTVDSAVQEPRTDTATSSGPVASVCPVIPLSLSPVKYMLRCRSVYLQCQPVKAMILHKHDNDDKTQYWQLTIKRRALRAIHRDPLLYSPKREFDEISTLVFEYNHAARSQRGVVTTIPTRLERETVSVLLDRYAADNEPWQATLLEVEASAESYLATYDQQYELVLRGLAEAGWTGAAYADVDRQGLVLAR